MIKRVLTVPKILQKCWLPTSKMKAKFQKIGLKKCPANQSQLKQVWVVLQVFPVFN